MSAVQWIKQWQRAHESRSKDQAVIRGTKVPLKNQAMNAATREPFNESRNVYGNMRAVFDESSYDYGLMRDVQ
jgi:hypothetical protein